MTFLLPLFAKGARRRKTTVPQKPPDATGLRPADRSVFPRIFNRTLFGNFAVPRPGPAGLPSRPEKPLPRPFSRFPA